MSRDIQAVIIGDSSRQDCDAACGTDWSLEESLDLARSRVKERFGNNVQVVYSDLKESGENDITGRWEVKIRNENLSVPLLVINDRLRISGNFDIRQMIDTIEAELEMGV